MKTRVVLKSALLIAAAGFVVSAFANTVSIPNEEHPAYTVDVPGDWNPKVDKEEETLEATEPDNHVYLSGWMVTKSDVGDLAKDIPALLKDSLKSIEGEPKEETIENNGIKFSLLEGHGKDKREGGDVQFLVAIFPISEGKAGVFYADWDADAPKGIKEKLNGIMNSIKLHK